MKPKIRFFVGGPAFHPTAEQASLILEDSAGLYDSEIVDGASAFDNLSDVDLLVVMGLHWTGMSDAWAGNLTYVPLNDAQKAGFRDFVASGRPLLCYHGGIASYDDWPEFGQLLGYQWRWGVTYHSPVGAHPVTVEKTPHPLLEEVGDFTLTDELYYNYQITPDLKIEVLGHAKFHGAVMPMIFAGQGGRIPGAGRSVYLANGHDLRAFECPALRTLIKNSINWLLSK
jgi:type 1 glutamine amidotransferase